MDTQATNNQFIDSKTIFILKLLSRIKTIEKIIEEESGAFKDKNYSELKQLVMLNRFYDDEKKNLEYILNNRDIPNKIDIISNLDNIFNGLDKNKVEELKNKLNKIIEYNDVSKTIENTTASNT
tara:strand:- start:4526 stop:4897 length:372 start_codon:yes stop_codon:yes gene_type:complete